MTQSSVSAKALANIVNRALYTYRTTTRTEKVNDLLKLNVVVHAAAQGYSCVHLRSINTMNLSERTEVHIRNGSHCVIAPYRHFDQGDGTGPRWQPDWSLQMRQEFNHHDHGQIRIVALAMAAKMEAVYESNRDIARKFATEVGIYFYRPEIDHHDG